MEAKGVATFASKDLIPWSPQWTSRKGPLHRKLIEILMQKKLGQMYVGIEHELIKLTDAVSVYHEYIRVDKGILSKLTDSNIKYQSSGVYLVPSWVHHVPPAIFHILVDRWWMLIVPNSSTPERKNWPSAPQDMFSSTTLASLLVVWRLHSFDCSPMIQWSLLELLGIHQEKETHQTETSGCRIHHLQILDMVPAKYPNSVFSTKMFLTTSSTRNKSRFYIMSSA